MGKPIIERYWNGGSLRYHNKIRRVYKEITSDIAAGVVFPAVRENEIHLYHEGGRIFRITPRSTYTHSRYLGKQGDRDVSLKALALEDYESIKECCEAHNSRKLKTTDEWQERWIVSRLFRRFSCWSEHAERGQPILGALTPEPLIVADHHRAAPTLDAEVKTLLLLPPGAEVTGGGLAFERDLAAGRLFRAVKPGIFQANAGDWAVFVRVAPVQKNESYGYIGLARYRHLEEDPDG